MRFIKEIIQQAESTKDLQILINLWNEIANNKKKYSLNEIRTANLKIRELTLKSNHKNDIDKGLFYNFLKNQIHK
jgi:hypothetical protein